MIEGRYKLLLADPDISRILGMVNLYNPVPFELQDVYYAELAQASEVAELPVWILQIMANAKELFNADRATTQKHGNHNQLDHGNRNGKSYSSIESLTSDATKLQNAVDEQYNSSIDQAANGNVAQRVLVEELGKGGQPAVVASIDQLDSEPIYRGTSSENADDFINSESHRMGLGQYGDGYYFSNKLETANDYAGRSEGPSAVTTAAWKADAKVYELPSGGAAGGDVSAWIDAATSAQNKAITKLNINRGASESQDSVFNMFYDNFASALVTDLILEGFDGMKIRNNYEETYTVVFNREALQVVSK